MSGGIGSVYAGWTRIVVASGNPHKVEEIGAILHEAGLAEIQLIPMDALEVPSPVEDGDTFAANALIKAWEAVRCTGLPVLADDSGLVVDALDGAPGVRSARYAGEEATDADNNAALVAALAEVPEAERTAAFVCAAVFAAPDGTEVVREGTMAGRIVAQAGSEGFGYDPLFLADATHDGRTNGQLAPAEKDAISHRGAAFRELASDVAAWLADRRSTR